MSDWKPDQRWARPVAQSEKAGIQLPALPKDREDSRMVPELQSQDDEMTVLKTTDSALTGTNLRLILHNTASVT